MKVLAAVSGGVDSAVALARAVDAGHDVTAVHMALSPDPALARNGARGCCTIADAHDARRAADVVGVPFYVWDLAERFRETVIADFVAEYETGRTPNPCVRCNEHVKFAALLDRALALGFDAVATGHYARLECSPSTGDHGWAPSPTHEAVEASPPSPDAGWAPVLRRAVDHGKDQSYVLAVLRPDQLRHAMFPLGGSPKTLVRTEAAERGLLVADKPDSHDICFIPDGDTAGFLRRQLGERPGPVVDAATGRTIGEHEGTYRFTVGQRRGLGVTEATPDRAPRYVLAIDPVSRTVVVGDRDRLAVKSVVGTDAVWHAAVPANGVPLSLQIRAHGAAVPCVVEAATATEVTVRTADPLFGVAPGQSAVLYDGDRVVGQATIGAMTP